MNRDVFAEAIERGGGITIYLRRYEDSNKLDALLEQMDGLLLSGGADVSPEVYGEEKNFDWTGPQDRYRDELEVYALKHALKNKKPILGICRGMQLINVYGGGSLHQCLQKQHNIHTHTADKYPCYYYSPTTLMNLEKGSNIAKLYEDNTLTYNCAHHQAVNKVASGYTPTAHAQDGTIEVIEKQGDDHWVMGIQGHPEATLDRQPELQKLFTAFVEQCQLYRNNR